jgi:hypothetical protein
LGDTGDLGLFLGIKDHGLGQAGFQRGLVVIGMQTENKIGIETESTVARTLTRDG